MYFSANSLRNISFYAVFLINHRLYVVNSFDYQAKTNQHHFTVSFEVR